MMPFPIKIVKRTKLRIFVQIIDLAMGKYSFNEQQIERLKATSMRDILSAEGLDTTHTRGGLFYSPFRERERTPSFHIDDVNHVWFDHGNPTCGIDGRHGGGVIDFVRLLKNCSFMDALMYLCRFNPGVVPGLRFPKIHVYSRESDTIVSVAGKGDDTYVGTAIDDVRERFSDRRLVDYASSRYVTRRILESVFREVWYTVTYVERGTGEEKTSSRKAIGLRNVRGGWMLRYPSKYAKGGKRSTGGGFSALDREGNNLLLEDLAPSCGNVVVFEGMFDFASWMVRSRPDGIPGDVDVVVLNSVANAQAALPFVTAHARAFLLLDNDKAGSDCTELVAAACREADCRAVDQRKAYAEYNDYSDYHTALSRGRGDDEKTDN